MGRRGRNADEGMETVVERSEWDTACPRVKGDWRLGAVNDNMFIIWLSDDPALYLDGGWQSYTEEL